MTQKQTVRLIVVAWIVFYAALLAADKLANLQAPNEVWAFGAVAIVILIAIVSSLVPTRRP